MTCSSAGCEPLLENAFPQDLLDDLKHPMPGEIQCPPAGGLASICGGKLGEEPCSSDCNTPDRKAPTSLASPDQARQGKATQASNARDGKTDAEDSCRRIVNTIDGLVQDTSPQPLSASKCCMSDSSSSSSLSPRNDDLTPSQLLQSAAITDDSPLDLPGTPLKPEVAAEPKFRTKEGASLLSNRHETTARNEEEDRPSHGAADGGVERWYQWPQDELPQIRPRSGEALRVFCGVWNLHGKSAPTDLGSWLSTRPRHHIYVIGTCECERSIQKSMIVADKSRWEQQVRIHFGEDYRMIRSQNMSAIHCMVFVHHYLWKYIWDIKSSQVATGIGNFIGNKGGTQISFNVGRTSILFINAHLASSATKMKERTQDFSRILTDSPMRRVKTNSGIHEEYDRVFFMGDLNPRVSATRGEVDGWLAERQFHKCLERDQLLPLLHPEAAPGKDAGLWHHFEEAPITFPPTYKFDAHSSTYDTSKKQRVPSWTDRILWRRDTHIRSMSYGSVQSMQISDHRPIFSQFEVLVDLEDWEGPDVDGEKKSECSLQ